MINMKRLKQKSMHLQNTNNILQNILQKKCMQAMQRAQKLNTPLLRYGKSIALNISELDFNALQKQLENEKKKNEKIDIPFLKFLESENAKKLQQQRLTICTLQKALDQLQNTSKTTNLFSCILHL